MSNSVCKMSSSPDMFFDVLIMQSSEIDGMGMHNALLITSCFCHLQGWVHQGFYGKPKAVCIDSYDRKLAKRDARIMQEIKQRQEAQTGGKKGFFS